MIVSFLKHDARAMQLTNAQLLQKECTIFYRHTSTWQDLNPVSYTHLDVYKRQVYSFELHGLLSAFGTSIFVISLFLMFLSSTIYHAMSYDSPQKYVLRIMDHSMIYIAIAGSYTPVVLTLMNNWMGYSIILIQWGTTIFGILYKIFAKKVNEKFSLALYLIMGLSLIHIALTLWLLQQKDQKNGKQG